ncbi:hypothetical protein [Brachybacterium sp. GPGPB12]|uniref:hypothetical protein n=1 Tax=Brachybacterium sp. GPGPB12 TaxID=3023517 RepID=UPI0031343EFF
MEPPVMRVAVPVSAPAVMINGVEVPPPDEAKADQAFGLVEVHLVVPPGVYQLSAPEGGEAVTPTTVRSTIPPVLGPWLNSLIEIGYELTETGEEQFSTYLIDTALAECAREDPATARELPPQRPGGGHRRGHLADHHPAAAPRRRRGGGLLRRLRLRRPGRVHRHRRGRDHHRAPCADRGDCDRDDEQGRRFLRHLVREPGDRVLLTCPEARRTTGRGSPERSSAARRDGQQTVGSREISSSAVGSPAGAVLLLSTGLEASRRVEVL